MDKIGMREWIASLEEASDIKLKKWKKEPKFENGEAVHLHWQWEQTRININVFWEDRKETVKLTYTSPRVNHDFLWHGLNNKTFNKIMDRIGNLSQITMHPPIDPTDGQ